LVFEVMREMIRQEKLKATFEGVEDPDEADDFDVGDDALDVRERELSAGLRWSSRLGAAPSSARCLRRLASFRLPRRRAGA
jgi:hypothetical protein